MYGADYYKYRTTRQIVLWWGWFSFQVSMRCIVLYLLIPIEILRMILYIKRSQVLERCWCIVVGKFMKWVWWDTVVVIYTSGATRGWWEVPAYYVVSLSSGGAPYIDVFGVMWSRQYGEKRVRVAGWMRGRQAIAYAAKRGTKMFLLCERECD